MDNATPLMIIFLGAVIAADIYLSIGDSSRIYENDVQINRLNFHNHSPTGRNLPINSDGELLHTLNGIRGWY